MDDLVVAASENVKEVGDVEEDVIPAGVVHLGFGDWNYEADSFAEEEYLFDY